MRESDAAVPRTQVCMLKLVVDVEGNSVDVKANEATAIHIALERRILVLQSKVECFARLAVLRRALACGEVLVKECF